MEHHTSARADTAHFELTAADELFVNLDRTVVTSGASSWQLEVCGIHQSRGQYWVQLNVIGAEAYSMTVRTRTLSAGAVRQQIDGWLKELPESVPAYRTV